MNEDERTPYEREIEGRSVPPDEPGEDPRVTVAGEQPAADPRVTPPGEPPAADPRVTSEQETDDQGSTQAEAAPETGSSASGPYAQRMARLGDKSKATSSSPE